MEISLEDFESTELPIGTPKTLIRMPGGFSNDNYLLTTSLGKYRIRLSQFSNNIDQLLAEQKILKWATKISNIIVPLLYLLKLPNGKYISIFPFVNADPKFDLHNEQLMRSAGKALAEYHLSVDQYKDKLPMETLSESFSYNPVDIIEIRASINESSVFEYPSFWNAVENLLLRIENMDKQLKKEPFISLPHLPCHGDYAPVNLLTLENKVVGIIDFECCRRAPRLYDLSTYLLSLQEGDGYEEFMSSWFLQGYQSIITLSKIEMGLIPIFKNLRSLEAAKRHFNTVIQGDHRVHAGLVLYWDRVTSKIKQ